MSNKLKKIAKSLKKLANIDNIKVGDSVRIKQNALSYYLQNISSTPSDQWVDIIEKLIDKKELGNVTKVYVPRSKRSVRVVVMFPSIKDTLTLYPNMLMVL